MSSKKLTKKSKTTQQQKAWLSKKQTNTLFAVTTIIHTKNYPKT